MANLKVTTTTLLPGGTRTSLRLNSNQTIRNDPKLPNSLAIDLENVVAAVNRLEQTLSTATPTVSQILLTDQVSGEVVGALGNLTYRGVTYTNYLSELHVGDPLGKHNPTEALFNANIDGSVSIGQSGWLDVHDPFEGNAAWIGTQFDTLAISGAANNGAGLIRLTVVAHTLITGDTAQVRNMQLAGVPNATGTWQVTRIDADHVDLQGSVWAGTYTAPPAVAGIDTSGPTIDRVLQVNGAADNGASLIRLQTSVAHGYESGDQVHVAAVGGVPNASGQWIVTVADATHFDLQGSTFAGAYTTGGTALRYFAGMLAQTVALGSSFQSYNIRAFADGSLRIKNATFSLVSGGNSIVLDPVGPAIEVNSATHGSIRIDGAAGTITVKDSGGVQLAQLGGDAVSQLNGVSVIGDQTVSGFSHVTGAITGASGAFTGAVSGASGAFTGAVSGASGSFTGNISAATFNGITGATGTVNIAGLSLLFDSGFFTASAGAFPSGVSGLVSIYGLNLLFASGILTGTSGALTGFSGTATVRNSAGTGTSSFVFVDGVCTNYTP